MIMISGGGGGREGHPESQNGISGGGDPAKATQNDIMVYQGGGGGPEPLLRRLRTFALGTVTTGRVGPIFQKLVLPLRPDIGAGNSELGLF